MPTAYDSHTPTIDRPQNTGEFTSSPVNAAGFEPIAPAQVEAPQVYSTHPGLQVEAERQAASELAMPADAHRGDVFTIPPQDEFVPESPEVAEYRLRAEAGEPTILDDAYTAEGGRLGDEAEDYLRRIAEPEAPTAAPTPELRYDSNGALMEAYNTACAMVNLRRSVLPPEQQL